MKSPIRGEPQGNGPTRAAEEPTVALAEASTRSSVPTPAAAPHAQPAAPGSAMPASVIPASAMPASPAPGDEACAKPESRPMVWTFHYRQDAPSGVRSELLGLIPLTARRILDVGCGDGKLGETIKARQTCQVVGVVAHECSGHVARSRLDQVLTGDPEAVILDWPADAPDTFDCIVLTRMLATMRNMRQVLERLRDRLAPGGMLLVDVPNDRHQAVLSGLMAGNWTKEPVLEGGQPSHQHVFTARRLEELLASAGWKVRQAYSIPGAAHADWVAAGRPGQAQIGQGVIVGIPPEEAEEFYVREWLVVAEGARVAVGEQGRLGSHGEQLPRCLVMMPTYNRLEYTRLALEGLLAQDYPGEWQLVIWDNGSTDGSVDWIRQRTRGLSHVRVIEWPCNRGVVFPMNEVWGADKRAELLAKVDNDTLVPPDWLRLLAEWHLASDRWGVLSGFHFRQEGEAQAEDRWMCRFGGRQVLRQPHVGGCAIMLKREVYERFGPIAHRTGDPERPFMDFGWTFYQEALHAAGWINGYAWPAIHVDHMEDTRSEHCIRSLPHQQYKRALRGMSLEESTQAMCIWRPMECTGEVEPTPVEPARATTVAAATARSAPGEQAPAPSTRGIRAAPRLVQAVQPGRLPRFHQDFDHDYGELVGRLQAALRDPRSCVPFAWVRFGEVERAICEKRRIETRDGWSYPGGDSPFAEDVREALHYTARDYYLGICGSDTTSANQPGSNSESRDWYLRQARVPTQQISFANLLTNANYQRFREVDLSAAVLVASRGGDIEVPPDVLVFNERLDRMLDRVLDRMLDVRRPILVSAGPATCVLIQRYWKWSRHKQVVLDAGSAIDEVTRGQRTQPDHEPTSREANMVCGW